MINPVIAQRKIMKTFCLFPIFASSIFGCFLFGLYARLSIEKVIVSDLLIEAAITGFDNFKRVMKIFMPHFPKTLSPLILWALNAVIDSSNVKGINLKTVATVNARCVGIRKELSPLINVVGSTHRLTANPALIVAIKRSD